MWRRPLSNSKNNGFDGTWINPTYSGKEKWYQVREIEREIIMRFSRVTDTHLLGQMEFAVKDHWTDSAGAKFYKITWIIDDPGEHGTIYYELGKLSKSGTTLEFVISRHGFPNEIAENHAEYRVYYRAFD